MKTGVRILALATLFMLGCGSPQKETPVAEAKKVDGKTLEEWLEALAAKNVEVRRAAADAIAKFEGADGAKAVEPLKTALADSDAGVALKAGRALIVISPGDKAAVAPAVEAALKGEDGAIRQLAAETAPDLGAAGKGCIDILIEALKDPDKQMKEKSAEALAKLPTAETAEPLARALSHRDTKVRQAAMEILTGKGPDVVPAVTAVLKSEDADVRDMAAQILAKLGPKAVPAFVEGLDDPKRDVRSLCATRLSDMGPDAKEAAPALVKKLNDVDVRVRMEAAKALQNIGKDAVPAVIEGLKSDEDYVRGAAVKILTAIGADAKPALEEAKKSGDAKVSKGAEEALSKIK